MTHTEPSHSHDPSLHTGNLKVREAELHEVMSTAVPMFELSDEEFEDAVPEFVANRMKELSIGASTEFMTNQTTGTEEFIVPERLQEIMGIMTKPFRMDDPELYVKLIDWTRKRYQALQASNPEFAQEKTYVNAAMRGTLVGQYDYFGSYAGDIDEIIHHVAPDIISDDDESPYVSIADFGKSAVCQQRAAAVHNTLRILGIDSKFATGTLSEIKEDEPDKSELHAYVVVNRHGKQILFDPTNPVLVKKEGAVIWMEPRLVEIPKDAREFDVGLPEVVMAEDGTQQNRLAHQLHYTLK